MKSLSTFITEAVNSHMTHVEDLVFIDGVDGAKQAFALLSSVAKMLSGHTKAPVSTTVKWDGAPSIFMGIDPADGKFFVAKKGIFAKNPKLYQSHADIDRETSGDLAKKFHVALDEFSKLGLKKGIIQGDLMFNAWDLKKEVIDSEKYLTFQPNTIVYAVPVASELASKIRAAKIGVIWHTTYTGSSIEKMEASFGKAILPRLTHKPSVWMDDANYKDVSGAASMTEKETKQIMALLAQAGTLLRSIPAAALNTFKGHEELLIRVNTYNNSKIREGQHMADPQKHASGLVPHIQAYFQKEMDSKKTDKGKASVKARMQATLAPLLRIKHSDLINIFRLYDELSIAKLILVRKMNHAASLGTFLRTADGFRATTPEGFCAIDHLTGNIVKLVDRLEFSHANFSPEVLKGWQK